MSLTKTIAIVGDSKGIGAALREQLLADGHRVIGVSRSGVQRQEGASGVTKAWYSMLSPTPAISVVLPITWTAWCIALEPFA